MFQHLRRIHILPPSVTNIDGSDILIAGHQLNCVSQAAIVPVVGGLRPLEIVEDLHGTNEQAGINRIVVRQVFPILVILSPQVWTFIASSKSKMESSFRSTATLRKSGSADSIRRSTIVLSKKWSLIVERNGDLMRLAAARTDTPFCFANRDFR